LEEIKSNFRRYKYELGIIEKFPIINTREMNIKIGDKIKNITNDKNAILKLIAHIIKFFKQMSSNQKSITGNFASSKIQTGNRIIGEIERGGIISGLSITSSVANGLCRFVMA
jgi:hypothetical protein